MPINQNLIDITNQHNQRAAEYAESYDPRFDWTPGEWDRQFRDSINIPSRQTRDNIGRGQQGPERWEYLFNGEWLNQDQYNDPMWRQNVYNPWMQEQQDNWNRQREEVTRAQRERKPPNPGFVRGPGRGGGGGAGRIGSRSSGGYDPAMLARLMGG